MSNQTTETEAQTLLTYKGRPLLRKDGLIYYGFQNEKYIVMLQILGSTELNDLKIASRVRVELQATDPEIKSKDRVLRKSEKDGLYSAMDIAAVWLERALAGK